VSTDAKAPLAREAGADATINYTQQDFAEEVRKATDGQGVRIVFDAVGKTTFDQSIKSLGRRGYLAFYGQASGAVGPIDTGVLRNGSLFLTRPGLGDYTATREELLHRASEVLGWVRSGELKLHVGLTLPLSQAAEAHRQLEGRQTTGKILLMP
jgi:NADPH2:quinone reductase